jgi:uncharacterized membrane protein YdjX (TVP38/TMEM64 family)
MQPGLDGDAPAPLGRTRIWHRLLVVAVAILALVGIGQVLRGSVEIEASAESLRRFVLSLGWWGPAVFVGLFLVRGALLLPGPVLLTAGGVCFGLAAGTFLGALGLVLSAGLKFLFGAIAGRDELLKRLPARARGRLKLMQSRGSAGIIALATAYPIGPADFLQIAAILAGMRATPFFVAVAVGALARAASLSFFGESLAEGRELLLATGILLVLSTLPLLVPRLRRAFLLR